MQSEMSEMSEMSERSERSEISEGGEAMSGNEMIADRNAAAMREALEYVLQFDASDDAAMIDGLTDAERIMELACHIDECQKRARAALAEKAASEKRWAVHYFCEAEKMREALEDISRGLEMKLKDKPASVTEHEMSIYRRCKVALAEPRNDSKVRETNAAALRQALESVRNNIMNKILRASHVTDEGMLELVSKALNEPPRNCDVGTAEEQYDRYKKQCGAQDCCDCPVHARWDFTKTGSESRQFVWEQMPYGCCANEALKSAEKTKQER